MEQQIESLKLAVNELCDQIKRHKWDGKGATPSTLYPFIQKALFTSHGFPKRWYRGTPEDEVLTPLLRWKKQQVAKAKATIRKYKRVMQKLDVSGESVRPKLVFTPTVMDVYCLAGLQSCGDTVLEVPAQRVNQVPVWYAERNGRHYYFYRNGKHFGAPLYYFGFAEPQTEHEEFPQANLQVRLVGQRWRTKVWATNFLMKFN